MRPFRADEQPQKIAVGHYIMLYRLVTEQMGQVYECVMFWAYSYFYFYLSKSKVKICFAYLSLSVYNESATTETFVWEKYQLFFFFFLMRWISCGLIDYENGHNKCFDEC